MSENVYIISTIITTLMAGIILGIIFYFIAKKKGKKRTAILGFWLIALAHFQIGLFLSLPVMFMLLLFVFL